MSAARPLPRDHFVPAAPTPRPRLRVIRSVPRPPLPPFIAVVAGLLLIGLVGLLSLNTVLARSSFTVAELSTEVAGLEEQQAALAEEVAVLESPTELARRAARLGMVAGGPPVFIDPATPAAQAPKQ